MSDDNDDWIEVRRVPDAIGAEMIRDFLDEHDVRVAIRGNPQATRMTWSQTSDTIRIVVAPADVEKATEVLAAMTAGDAHPFRGSAPMEHAPEERAEAFVKPRSAVNAAVLGIIVPVGGGHFYARHGAAGTILAAGAIAAVVGMWFGHGALARAWAIVIAADIVGSYWAVRRFNENRVPPENVRRRWAIGAVVVAFAAAWLGAPR